MKHIENMIASVWLRYWSNCWNTFGLSNKKTYHWIGKVTALQPAPSLPKSLSPGATPLTRSRGMLAHLLSLVYPRELPP